MKGGFLAVFIFSFLIELPIEAVAEYGAKEEEPETIIYPPIRHYRTGSGTAIGLSAESKQRLLAAYQPPPEVLSEMRARVPIATSETREKFKQIYEKPLDRIMPCVEDKVTHTKFEKSVGKDSDLVLTDYLFVPRDMLPTDPHAAFGKRVMMFVYDFNDPKSPVPDIARGMGVKCVPFRLRGSVSQVTRYEGSEALQNFEPEQKAAPPRKKAVERMAVNTRGGL